VTTAAKIIGQSLGLLGIRSSADPVTGADAVICLERLNTLLDAWKVQPGYAYAATTISGALGAGVASLTIGPTGDLATTRPVRIEMGTKYTVDGFDYPIRPVTRQDFEEERLKTLQARGPCVVHYNPTLPDGVLHFWPTPSASVTLTVLMQVQLTAFADLTTDYSLPPGYERALVFTLAEEVGPDFERDVPPTVSKNAANARRLLMRSNHDVPQLDVCLPIGRHGRFDIISGGHY
jgi:hypothetical protein